MQSHVSLLEEGRVRFNMDIQRRKVYEDRFEDTGLKDKSDATTNQGMPAAFKNWKNEEILPSSHRREHGPADTLILT